MQMDTVTKICLTIIVVGCLVALCFVGGDLAVALVGLAGTAVGGLAGVSIQNKVNGR